MFPLPPAKASGMKEWFDHAVLEFSCPQQFSQPTRSQENSTSINEPLFHSTLSFTLTQTLPYTTDNTYLFA